MNDQDGTEVLLTEDLVSASLTALCCPHTVEGIEGQAAIAFNPETPVRTVLHSEEGSPHWLPKGQIS